MSTQAASTAKGLEGIVIAQTQLSYVDGQAGKLIYHGYPIEVLARNATFEEVAYLLWENQLPSKDELDTLKANFRENRPLPDEIIDILKHIPKETHPMGVLRTAVSVMGNFDPEQEDSQPEANRRKAMRLAAKIPTAIAAWYRIREGEDVVSPHESLDHAANFMYMMHGEEASEAAVRAIDAYLVLLADHGMNASTFSARVTTSTQGDIYSAVTTGVGTLKGPAHGGANERVMKMLLEIGELDNAEAWFKKVREAGERIMGIGHRVYKVDDPRAVVIREMARDIAETTGNRKWFDIAVRIEELSRQDDYFVERNLYPNVDFYSAPALYSVGIPTDFFTPMFAMSRVAGWTAHVMEQWAENRLIRPRGEYVGPQDQEWVPLDER